MSLEGDRPTLTVVIPALNEEDAIGMTIRRCLDARAAIGEAAGVLDVELIVVSDGSTDRTVEIAQGFDGVRVITFEENRGYGAAIKEGFRQGRGSLLGFMDADGTCDPLDFAELCRVAIEDKADIVLGSRLGPHSKMPAVRRLGNRTFAVLLSVLCGRLVTDTASGMRVVRREALHDLYPLPDRLHFTPSMSSRALMSGLSVIEVPIRYEERIGTSKLSVLRDGVLFFRTIVEGVLCYRPERPFMIGFALCLLAGLLLGMAPFEFYLQQRAVEEWMIYRFMACFMLGATGFLLLSAAVLAHRMADLGLRRGRRNGETIWLSLLPRLFRGKALGAFLVTTLAGSVMILWPGVVEYVSTRHVSMHWSRLIVASFGLLLCAQAVVTWILLGVIEIWKGQHEFRARPEQAHSPRSTQERADRWLPQGVSRARETMSP
jgi:glycosyltransferase involved in cell wall biosynthesis